MKKIINLIRTFRNPLRVILDRLGKLKSPNVVHTLRSGLKVKCRPGTSDAMILYDIFADREYEPADLPQFRTQREWFVLDLGANIGCFSLLAASRGALVVAYEALVRNFEIFRENIALNDFEIAIQPVCRPVSDKERDAEIHLAEGSSSLHWHTKAPGEKVRTIAIADVLAGVGKVDLLKCDIEGEEFAVFSALSTQQLSKIKRIIMEYHNYGDFDHTAIIRQLKRNGYEVWDRPKAKNPELYGLLFAERRYLA